MKLRIKLQGTVIAFTVEVENGQVAFQQLRNLVATELVKCCPKLSGVGFSLSLNGKTKIEVEENTSLNDSGIVSGDLLLILLTTDISEILGDEYLCKRSSESRPAAAKRTDVQYNSASTANYAAVNMKMKLSEDEKNNEDTEEEEEGSFVNRFMNGPMLCREATNTRLPCNLIREYRNSLIITEIDALICVIKVLMNEEGFVLKENAISKSDNKTMILKYAHSICPEIVCHLMCIPIAEMLLVHGIFSNKVVLHSFPVKLFIKAKPLTQHDPIGVYQRLSTLSRQVKDHIIFPLIKTVFTAAGFTNVLCFETLPIEIMIHILRMLDFRSLIHVSQLSKQFQKEANDNLLWKVLFFRDFKTTSDAQWQKLDELTADGFWKSAYKEAFLQKRWERKSRAPLPMVWTFDRFIHQPWSPLLQMTGGDYDRFPVVSRMERIITGAAPPPIMYGCPPAGRLPYVRY